MTKQSTSAINRTSDHPAKITPLKNNKSVNTEQSIVIEVMLDDLISDNLNANNGTEFGGSLMDKSFRKFGAGRSILLDKNNRIIAGNKSAEKCAEIGLNNVIIVETDGTKLVAVKRTDIDIDSKQGRELAIADNATNKENLDWNHDNITIIHDEFDIDPMEWGIETNHEENVDVNEDVIPVAGESTIKKGDIIEMNNHRLLCGNSCDAPDIALLMNGKQADLVFTDPPYDLEDNKKWIDNLNNVISNGHIIIMIADKQLSQIISNVDAEFHRMYIADTGIASPTNNDVYVNHILTLRFSKGKFPKFNNIHNGGRSIIKMDYRKNNKESVFHPHSKPIAFVEMFLMYWSVANQIVLDLFGGSGSTLIAAEKNNRICYMNEFEPAHCDIILKRWVLYMQEHSKLFQIKINGKEISENILTKIAN